MREMLNKLEEKYTKLGIEKPELKGQCNKAIQVFNLLYNMAGRPNDH